MWCIQSVRKQWISSKVQYNMKIKPNSNPVWILTVETLLDKLQHVEWNSLTKLHKRGQNPHGESHNRASRPNESYLISSVASVVWITTMIQFSFMQDHMPMMLCSWMFFLIIQSLYFSFCHFNPPPPPSHPYTTTHTCIPATPPLLACTSWCVFHLILFNEPHFTVRSLMTLIN